MSKQKVCNMHAAWIMEGREKTTTGKKTWIATVRIPLPTHTHTAYCASQNTACFLWSHVQLDCKLQVTTSNERDGAEVTFTAASQKHEWSHTHSPTAIIVISSQTLGGAGPRAWLNSSLFFVSMLSCWRKFCVYTRVCVLMRSRKGASRRLQGDLAPSNLFSGCFRMAGDTQWQTDGCRHTQTHTCTHSAEDRQAPCPSTDSLDESENDSKDTKRKDVPLLLNWRAPLTWEGHQVQGI